MDGDSHHSDPAINPFSSGVLGLPIALQSLPFRNEGRGFGEPVLLQVMLLAVWG